MYDETYEPTRRCLPPSRSGRVVRVGGVAAELASEVGPVRPGADDAGVAGHDAVLIFRGARASGAERSRAVVGIGEVMEQPLEPPLLPPTSSKGTGWNRVPGSARSPGFGADIRNRRNSICGASWRCAH